MSNVDDLTIADRLSEVACILAAGVLRLHARSALAVNLPEQPGPENLPETTQDCLDVVAETVLSVHLG